VLDAGWMVASIGPVRSDRVACWREKKGWRQVGACKLASDVLRLEASCIVGVLIYAGFRSCRGMSAALRSCEGRLQIFSLCFSAYLLRFPKRNADRSINGASRSALTPAIGLPQSLPSSPLAGPLHPLNVFKHGGSARQEGNPVSTLDRHIARHESLWLIMHPSLYLDRAPLCFDLAPYC